jgi:hypothetical protein
VRRWGNLHFSELSGAAFETENGWKPFDGSLDLDIDYFQARRVLVRLPLKWNGEERKPDDWVFLEGDHFCQRHHQSLLSLKDSLYGVGEPLLLSIGPYNYSSSGKRLTKGLLNSGVIRWISQEAGNWLVQLRHSLDLGEGYVVWAWLAGEDSPRQLRRDQWSQQENICEIRSLSNLRPEGFAISYDGTWLGARTASSRLYGVQEIINNTPSWETTAGWLRWWRAPLLHETLKTKVKATAEADPVNTLISWLTNVPPGAGAVYSDNHRHAWLSVIRSALWSWYPTPEQSSAVILRTGMITGNANSDFNHCWNGFEHVLAANPILLAQLSVRGLAETYRDFSSAETQIFLRMLQSLILGLERNATNVHLKSTFEVCQREAAKSMSVDEKFLTDSLLPVALGCVEGKSVPDLNLRIALANGPIRKFLAVSLLQHATAEQPLRISS